PPHSPLFPYTTLFRSPPSMRRTSYDRRRWSEFRARRRRAPPARLGRPMGDGDILVLLLRQRTPPRRLAVRGPAPPHGHYLWRRLDRKSTRLNSSHVSI